MVRLRGRSERKVRINKSQKQMNTKRESGPKNEGAGKKKEGLKERQRVIADGSLKIKATKR